MITVPLPILAIAIFFPAAADSSAAVLWQQDFDNTGPLSSYVGSATDQFDDITSSGTGYSWSVTDGALQGIRSGNAGAATINSRDFATPVLLVELRLRISSVNASGTTAVMFATGSSFDTTNTHPGNDDTHSDFSLNFTDGTPDTLRFRDHDNGTNLGNAAAGTDAIPSGEWIDLWWGINNSGAALSYSRPDGSSAVLQDDRWDLWANIGGTWHQIGNNPSNTSNTGNVLDDFKISFVRGEGTILLDSIKLSDTIEVVPEPASLVSAASVLAFTPFRRLRERRNFVR